MAQPKPNWDAATAATNAITEIEKTLAEIGAAVAAQRPALREGDCAWDRVGTLVSISLGLSEQADRLLCRGEYATPRDTSKSGR